VRSLWRGREYPQALSAHPAAVQHYPRVVENLAEAIKARAPDGEMARAIRELVESVN
jgi:hypothetical protein